MAVAGGDLSTADADSPDPNVELALTDRSENSIVLTSSLLAVGETLTDRVSASSVEVVVSSLSLVSVPVCARADVSTTESVVLPVEVVSDVVEAEADSLDESPALAISSLDETRL